ncbi:ABC-type multidrug transport system fused ATPase/permease subunit [Ruminococcaceae bacterium R-25]|nr:ABC-type multidrug transport system fused ATPase/permease subunit [Ruminococcaceae bacterium R-25]SUQ11657.1 ABC-type multidrug transport system, ATPase and permease component [Oscillospiraceae bacterium]
MGENKEKQIKYTGINKLFHNDNMQKLHDSLRDGTFKEFVDDWKWIFSYSKKYRWIVVFYAITGILGSTMSIGTAYIGRIMINIIVEKQQDKLWILIAAMIGSLILSLVLSSVNSYISARISIYVNNDIQADIFERIMDARWKELSSYPSGDLLNRFNGDVGTIASNAIGWIPNLLVNIYSFIVTFIVLWRMDIGMAIIAFISAPFLLGLSRFILRKMKEYRKRVLELNSKMMSFEVETFYNFEMIKSFGIFGYYSRKLKGWQQKYKEFNLDYNKFQIKSNILLTLVSTIVSSTAFAYCLYRLWTGQILYGDMTFFLQQRSALSSRFNSLVGTIPGMINSAVSAHRVRELLDLPREEHDPDRVTYMEERTGKGVKVHVNDVTFGYDERANVYEHSDLHVSSGEIVAIMAESGGGKTTLIRLLLGMLEPNSGKVTLQSGSGEEFPVNSDLRKFFSYVPQGNTMFSGTIAENMRMVNEDATDEEVIEALKTACAWDFIKQLPEGINSTLGERGRGLSEGQAQRISIARALLRGAPILLLDEATSALDRETEEQVLHNIMSSHPDRLIILSTHRPAALRLCSRIYKISGGKISETTIEEALALQSVLAEKKASSVQGVNYDRLIRPMGPKENEPSEGNNEEGWWNS